MQSLELLGLDSVSLVIKKGRLRQFGHVEVKMMLVGSNIVQQWR